MSVYSFQPQFIAAIRAGVKGGTIRKPRRPSHRGFRSAARQAIGGHAYPGEWLALYCQQRSPHGFLIDRKQCVAVEPISLDFAGHTVSFPASGLRLMTGVELSQFARFDGFVDWPAMTEFWRTTHDRTAFEGWHVRWLELPVAIAAAAA